MLVTPGLAASIEALYRVFLRYELRSSTNPCLCCHSTQDERTVRHKPLNKLSSHDLQQYAMDAIYTWGTGYDFKHFLPRLFELLIVGCDGFVDAAVIFGKLNYESYSSTRWRTWPDDEQKAVSEYFHAAWEAILDSDPSELPFDGAYGWIEAIAQAEHDLSKYLALWLTAESPHAHRNLALMIINEGVPNATRPTGGYWSGHIEQWEQVNTWLRRPEVRQKLANGLERWSDLSFAGELMDAAVLLPS